MVEPARVRACLESFTTDHDIVRQLHDVAPHAVYEVRVDGRRAICKVTRDARGGAPLEGRVLAHVGRETNLPVPEVYWVDECGFVAEYLETTPPDPLPENRLTRAWLEGAGRTLARLHNEVTFDRAGLLAVDGDVTDPTTSIAVDAPTDATWGDALDALLRLYGSSLEGTRYTTVIDEAREFCARHADRFDGLEARSLLHGWFTPEHVAIEVGEPIALIDFEHALVGTGEWDFWRTAMPLFLGPAWEGPDESQRRFREAYESVRPLEPGFDDRAEAYRALVAVSHLDSLATQRGIDDETRAIADSLEGYVRSTLADLEDDWCG